ncbi:MULTISPECIES: sarcosine oxidase subunit gamma family protein [Rhizobium]|uniref:Sarcosine oxidase, subunit gamma n=1 Tax=Rhizobium favelukesii TaxID=348824 RepID=W6RJ98_9HYPH|nr:MULTISPECIES: sarcosine oxidase subunit gamma family protein [Rhizobium]MCA0806664.1 sarcosine oxidase subunit gamma [Rhizobium sp. T1473]MCS0459862.1 sarcosine oxidase subunit gamma [Rhizobium favelukesii]UFS85243.1 sarcosine oxidase subunit gamma [Rhizobium sp. T136]CDM61247.1 sarcosine oxidase, subunit gamma [Rhizobium favelukesii]
MVDFSHLHRPALADAKSGSFGASSTGKRIRLTALPEGHVLQVLAARGSGELQSLIPRIGDGTPHSVRPYGPGQWFVVGDAPLSATEIFGRTPLLDGRAWLSDQGHGRIRIGISGPAVETVLAKGTAVDLDSANFPVGRSAITLIGHISALITRTGMESFELLVLRGFAESLWDELIQMSLEFGVDAKTMR